MIATVLLLVCSLALRAFAGDAVDQQASADEARALATATDASLARGDYQTAIRQALSAFDLHEGLGAHADAACDLNAIGLANQYLGRYAPALDAYHRALGLDRIAGAHDGEITGMGISKPGLVEVHTRLLNRVRHRTDVTVSRPSPGCVDPRRSPSLRRP